MIRVLYILLLGLISFDSFADDDYRLAQRLVEQGKIMALEDILRQSKIFSQQHILEIEFEIEDGRYLYELEVLNQNGVVTEYYVDAVSGKVLKVTEEDDR